MAEEKDDGWDLFDCADEWECPVCGVDDTGLGCLCDEQLERKERQARDAALLALSSKLQPPARLHRGLLPRSAHTRPKRPQPRATARTDTDSAAALADTASSAGSASASSFSLFQSLPSVCLRLVVQFTGIFTPCAAAVAVTCRIGRAEVAMTLGWWRSRELQLFRSRVAAEGAWQVRHARERSKRMQEGCVKDLDDKCGQVFEQLHQTCQVSVRDELRSCIERGGLSTSDTTCMVGQVLSSKDWLQEYHTYMRRDIPRATVMASLRERMRQHKEEREVLLQGMMLFASAQMDNVFSWAILLDQLRHLLVECSVPPHLTTSVDPVAWHAARRLLQHLLVLMTVLYQQDSTQNVAVVTDILCRLVSALLLGQRSRTGSRSRVLDEVQTELLHWLFLVIPFTPLRDALHTWYLCPLLFRYYRGLLYTDPSTPSPWRLRVWADSLARAHVRHQLTAPDSSMGSDPVNPPGGECEDEAKAQDGVEEFRSDWTQRLLAVALSSTPLRKLLRGLLCSPIRTELCSVFEDLPFALARRKEVKLMRGFLRECSRAELTALYSKRDYEGNSLLECGVRCRGRAEGLVAVLLQWYAGTHVQLQQALALATQLRRFGSVALVEAAVQDKNHKRQ